MRLTLAATFILSMAVFIACQSTEIPEATSAPHESAPLIATTPVEEKTNVDEHGHEDNAPRIELAKAKELFDKGEAFFIDTRSANNFAIEHIEGAVNIPVSAIEARAEEVPEGKTVIAYCS
ncbi:MAG: rhodanese-like domain-containing protein [Acidobacteria bacterium]|nr:MAG: rhodanese-like domain-containing protein [Acidobacteriota bacterium]REK02744.1 MAG: rhodanese-like domain-containing protein [Acidobacteriota bacterium]REK13451.1 MAG: rhodanese-like domain-containing protein [Acidobacteriota bacterium]REK41445.1 MAG: rhodanese-like domain-containing protein [Acidobacteriota bacterium]